MELAPASLLSLAFAVGFGVLPPAHQTSPEQPGSRPTASSPLEHCEMFPEACAWENACYSASIPLACGQSLSLVVGEDPVAVTSREPCSGENIPPEGVFALSFNPDGAQDFTFTVTSDPPGLASLYLISGCYTITCVPFEQNAEGDSLSAHEVPYIYNYVLLVRGLADGAHEFTVTASCDGSVPVRKLSWGLLKSRYAN